MPFQATQAKGFSFSFLKGRCSPTSATYYTALGTVALSSFAMSLNFKRRGSPFWSSLLNSSIIFVKFFYHLFFPSSSVSQRSQSSWAIVGIQRLFYSMSIPIAVLSFRTVHGPREEWVGSNFFLFCFVFFFLSFCFVRAALAAYGGSQARGPIGAVDAGLRQSHSNTGSKPCPRPTPQLMATPDP